MLDSKTFAELFDFTGDTDRTYFDSSGVLQNALLDTPRFDYEPVALVARGILFETSRSNLVRNNTMIGAVVGSPGTAPTNWALPSADGMTRTIVALGAVNGIDYVDIRFQGTPTVTTARIARFETNTSISIGTTYGCSVWFALVAGSLTNVTGLQLRLADEAGSTTLTPDATLIRQLNIRTAAANTTSGPTVRWVYGNTTTPTDFTFRFGLPQIEVGNTITSVIRTTGATVTRDSESLSIKLISGAFPWFNQIEGTVVWESMIENVGSIIDRTAWHIDDGTNNNRHSGRTNQQSTTSVAGFTSVGGVLQSFPSQGVVSNLVAVKAAYTFKANDMRLSVNGQAPNTDLAGSMPSGLNIFRIGREPGGTHLNGWLRRLKYYRRHTYSDVELQALAT